MKNTSLENIAKQWKKISNTEITNTYNNGKIVNLDDIKDINILKQSNHYTFIMMKTKTKNPSKIDLLIKEFKEFKVEVRTKFQNIEDRLDNIVVKNNLLE